MTDLLDSLQHDHVNLKLLLDVLERQFERLKRGADADFRLMADIAHYLTSYADVIHHPHEEVLFSKLEERDAGARDALARVRDEHTRLHQLGGEFSDLVKQAAGGAITPLNRLIALGRDYVALNRWHIDSEENEVFPRIREKFSGADWAEIDAAIDKQDDPLFGRMVQDSFRELYETIREELP